MRQEEETPRRVTVSRAFWISATEVTQEQWMALMPLNRSAHPGKDRPVTAVSWTDAAEFCAALSAREKRDYRLPTEAEWEYACKAGGDGVPGPGRDAVAWSAANSDDAPQPVGRKAQNAWGLFDMLGNVAEWTQDSYAPYRRVEAETDPKGPESGSARVVRGGSWRSFPPALRCAARASAGGAYQLGHVGFRVVRDAGFGPGES
jgi:formylglycine-generating enzyme required for sulfatase activity